MIDFEKRLESLKSRRQGSRERAIFESFGLESYAADSAIRAGRDVREKEAFESLKESAGVKYAIGAMAPVDHKSTQVSIDEGNRVSDTLIAMLKTAGINASKKMQGSVALDIHIEGHSDVDMLIICEDTVLVETPKLDGTACYASDKRPMVDIVAALRQASEDKLSSRYHEANVDCTNSKSISIEGGSLKRKVDIVPSCWYHTHDYQRSRQEKDAGVKIYNKKEHKLLGNFPFKHIARVNERDNKYSGNLKKVIRLLKNVVADMPDYKKSKAKALTSYDLAGIAYHMDAELNVPTYLSLSLVEQTRSYLNRLASSEAYRNALSVPDDTRKIFDGTQKVEALNILAKEVEDLALAIFKELMPLAQIYDSRVLKAKVI